jgi:phage terminase large subunit-like protein
MSDDEISPQELRKRLIETLDRGAYRKERFKLDYYAPYPKQAGFHALGSVCRERLLIAGNQQGKTFAGAYETAMHLSGLYPKNWRGHRFKHPVKAWACGLTGQKVRDVVQSLLLGPAGRPLEQGSGAVPLECIKETVRMHGGLVGAIDYAVIEHRTNGIVDGESIVWYKSYEQGRPKFQSDQIHVIWLDEEPEDGEIYSECLARLSAVKGIIYMTYTAMLGPTALTNRFMDECSPDRAYVTMAITDALHIDPADYERIENSYPPHERDCRVRGIPMRGEGAVFPVPIETLIHDYQLHELDDWCQWGWGIDFGIAHHFGAVLGAFDPYRNILYLMAEYKEAGKTPIHHCAAMRDIARGDGIPVFWPHDGNVRDRGSGDALKSLYARHGARMYPEHSTLPEGGFATDAGVMLMWQMMDRGQFKVARAMVNGEWGKEFRAYHRKNNQIVRINDDLMSSTRQLVMMLRFAKPLYLCDPIRRNTAMDRGWDNRYRGREVRGGLAKGVDFDVFNPHADDDQSGPVRAYETSTGVRATINLSGGKPDGGPRRGGIARGTDFDPF